MLSSLVNVFFPAICPLCEGGLIRSRLCRECADSFESSKIRPPFCTVCGAPFHGKAGGSHACSECLAEKRPFERLRSAFKYEGRVRDALLSLKFNAKTTVSPALGAEITNMVGLLPSRPDMMAPVPLHIDRLKQRGFNQALLIAKAASKDLGIKVVSTGLRRVKATRPQTGLKHGERLENVKDAFEVIAPSVFAGAKVLLVDDVFTTGATMRECAMALKKAGAEVYAITIARTSA